jgi:hypothetical protein
MNCRTRDGPCVSSRDERDRNNGDGLDFASEPVAAGLLIGRSSGPPKVGGLTSEPGKGEPIACICSFRLREQGDGVVRVIPGRVSGVLGPSLDRGEDMVAMSSAAGIATVAKQAVTRGSCPGWLANGLTEESCSSTNAGLSIDRSVSLICIACSNSSAVKLLPR